MREIYVNEDFYTEYSGLIPQDELNRALRKASRHIDSLTFNRIVGRFDDLTEFQQETIRECCCELADFEYENGELIESVLSDYSINGVSMKFGENWNVSVESGVAIRKDIYDMLKQTGLCCRRL